jgi:hypothetical protein
MKSWQESVTSHTLLVRPHLEFAAPIWNPYYQKGIDKLENAHHRATRLKRYVNIV